jgi:CheY-like chemotaxis protein
MTEAKPNSDPKRILYFEDNPVDAAFMQLVCGPMKDVDLVIATDARLGFQLVKAHDFSLILMEIMLPDMNGFDVTAELKKAPETKDIPVIAVSGAPMPKEYETPGDLGFVAYITKPVDPDSMTMAIQSILNEKDWRDV